MQANTCKHISREIKKTNFEILAQSTTVSGFGMKQILVLLPLLWLQSCHVISAHSDHGTRSAESNTQNVISQIEHNLSVMNRSQLQQIFLSLGSHPLKHDTNTTQFGSNSTVINSQSIADLCPHLIELIISPETHHYSLNQQHFNHGEGEDDEIVESRSLVWIYGTIAVTCISLCGLAGVLVIPIIEKSFYFYVLQFFTALAVGTLTGDSLMHLIPHAIQPSSDNIDSEQLHQIVMQRGVATMLGIITFWLIEKCLIFITSRKKTKASETHEITRLESGDKHHGHSHGNFDTKSDSLSSIVWMVVLGDGLHNLTDGMTIGAAFSQNIAGGFSTTVAVLCHELPHELGDFAVLLKAGMSAKQAIFYNILSSVLSFFGMCMGIVFGDTPETSQWVFAVAAGLFIYIALVDMVSGCI